MKIRVGIIAALHRLCSGNAKILCG